MAEDDEGSFLASKRPLAIAAVAALTAVVGLLIARYVPGLLERFEDPQPVLASAEYDAAYYGESWTVGFREAFGPQGPPLEGLYGAVPWALNQGAALVGEARVTLDVEGRRDSAVTIRSMRARVLERTEPYAGALVRCPTAGVQDSVGLFIDLDSENAIAHEMRADETLGEPYFSNHVVTLGRDEVQRFTLVGRATRSQVRWVVELVVDVDGSRSVVVAGDDGFVATPAEAGWRESWECGYQGAERTYWADRSP